jgi:predicted GNAT family acetyltransferase
MNEPNHKPEPIAIEHAEDEGRGAFFVQREGVRLGEMTYTRAGSDMIIIDHTEVSEKLRGLGVARRLLDAAVAWARATKTRVMVTCAYARAQFDKDPSIRDVLA